MCLFYLRRLRLVIMVVVLVSLALVVVAVAMAAAALCRGRRRLELGHRSCPEMILVRAGGRAAAGAVGARRGHPGRLPGESAGRARRDEPAGGLAHVRWGTRYSDC